MRSATSTSLFVALVVATGACNRSAEKTPAAPVASVDATASREAAPDLGVPSRAFIETTKGRISCELFQDRAPITVTNFAGLASGEGEWRDDSTDEIVRAPYYDGLPFHRVEPGFIIQAGRRNDGEGPGYSIPDEFDPTLRHDGPGVLSMANHGPNTGGAEFFITLAPAPHLDGRHTVFGRCEGPMDEVGAGDLINTIVIERTPPNAD